MSHGKHITFEEKFGAFVPRETRVSNLLEQERVIHEHDEAGMFVKLLAYLIDVAVSILIVPIIYNIYHYLKWGQTLGQQLMGIRIYRFRHHGKPHIASIPQLLLRFCSKLLFLGSWAFVGMTITTTRFQGGDTNPIVQLVFLGIMLTWIHAYTISMWFNKHHRGLHDIGAGTVVAYDAGFEIKRAVLGAILCVCLYYIVLILGPKIMILIAHGFEGPWLDIYRSLWNWIDYWVLHGMYSMGLAK